MNNGRGSILKSSFIVPSDVTVGQNHVDHKIIHYVTYVINSEDANII